MEIDEIDELQKWLDEHKYAIPKKQVRKETILDIAGIEHLENPWSDIYRYFFDIDASHGLSRLFIDSLQNLLKEKNNQYIPLVMEHFKVSREVAVQDKNGNNKRIDLLLYNDDEAIIVENKVYASLYNRLDLYWEKPEVPEENKRGVVLSLYNVNVKNKHFVNITHEELAKEIEKQLPSYFLKVQPKALILLQDFIQNIYNMTHPINTEEISFYFQDGNREKINRLSEIRNDVIKHIWTTIEDEKALGSLFNEEGWELELRTKREDNYVYYAFNKKPEKVMITLVYSSLWNYKNNGCRIRMFFELKSDMIAFAEKYSNELKQCGIVSQKGLKKERTIWHFCEYDIPFQTQELISKDVILSKIIQGIKDSRFYEYGQKIIELYNDKHKKDTNEQV